MRILITAGGTTEPIDQVRSITNHSTGRLGQAIAENILENTNWQVDYLTTPKALKPNATSQLKTFLIESTAELAETLANLMQENSYDAVIHSMAVSDFTGETAVSQESFIQSFLAAQPEMSAAGLENFLQQLAQKPAAESKISSDTDRLILTLQKTPKVIAEIKKLQPETLLIGFKLLVGVSKEKLFSVAQASIEKNQADYILANDLTEIQGENHHAYLLAKNGDRFEAFTKTEIATLIRQTIEKNTETGEGK